jgi:hypothetical protein
MASITVQEWLTNLAPDVRLIIKQLRAVARKNLSKAHEFICHDSIGYSVNDSPFDRICYIAPQLKCYVNMGFLFGVGLPNPEKLLIGEGKGLWHVKVWSVEEAKNPTLAKLIDATSREAPEAIAKLHAGMKKSKV